MLYNITHWEHASTSLMSVTLNTGNIHPISYSMWYLCVCRARHQTPGFCKVPCPETWELYRAEPACLPGRLALYPTTQWDWSIIVMVTRDTHTIEHSHDIQHNANRLHSYHRLEAQINLPFETLQCKDTSINSHVWLHDRWSQLLLTPPSAVYEVYSYHWWHHSPWLSKPWMRCKPLSINRLRQL